MANKYIRDLTPWPANLPLPTDGRPFFYDPATDREYTFTPGQLAAGAGGRARATAWVFAQRIEQYELKSNSLGRVFFALNLILSPVNEPFLPTSAAADNALYQLVGPDDALMARVTADETALTAHTTNQTNPHAVTAAQLPDFTTAARALFSAGNVLTYSTATGAFTLPAATATQAGYLSAADFSSFSQKQAALGYVAENAANKGAANGYAPLDGGRLIPAVFLPSYVDDIEEYATLSAFPAVGQTGKIYLAVDDLDGQWRWAPGSSSYRKFNSSIGTTDNLVEGSTNRYFTSARVLASTITGYVKDTANRALTAGMSLLVALGVLEKRIDDNTQNITANTAAITANTNGLLARFTNRGTFAANTAYATNDVIVQAGNAYFRQLGAFTPTAFVAGDWVAFSTPQFTPDQVATFLASASPVLILPSSGAPIGYNTLDAALSVANRIQPTSVILNVGLFTIQTSNPTRGFANWPAYFDARGATIQINDGITLTASGGSQITCVITNIFIVGQTANTGVFSIPAGYSPIALTAATAAQLVDCSVSIPTLFNGGYATLINGYYKSLTGTGTVFLYGNVQADSIASTLTIVDRRPGATAPAVATAITAGTVKIGSGITVTADGTISAAASGGTTSPATATTAGIVKAGQNTAVTTDGTLSVAGVYRGVWVANTVFKANDTVLNPSGQLVAAVADFTSGASYTASNWTLNPGQSTNDYTAAAVARLGVGVALATAATDLSSAINEVRNTLPGTSERSAAYTLALTDAGNVVPVNSATAVALTIPPNASVAFPIGTVVNASQVGAGQVLVTAGTGVTIRQADSQLKTAKQWAEVSLRKRNTDEWVLTGYTAA